MHLDPASAEPLAQGGVRVRADAVYTSMFLGGNGNGNSFEMDGELMRTGIKAHVGLGYGLEFRAELPFLHTTSGVLDSFMIKFHELVGAPDQGRSDQPRDRWSVRAERGPITSWEMEEDNGLSILDIPLEVSWAFLPVTEDRPYGLALRGGLELPTGNERRGFGSGETDYAVGVLGEYRLGYFGFVGHLSHTWAGTPESVERARSEFRDVTSFGLAAECAVSDSVSVLVQSEWESSTLRELQLSRAADPQWLIWFGLRTRLSDAISLEMGLAEDIGSFISPDFSAYLGMLVELGPGSGGT